MKTGHCCKNDTYHRLLVKYIEEIGTVERPPSGRELCSVSAPAQPGQQVRSVGQVEEKGGAWDLYLVCMATTGPYRMVRRRVRCFASQTIAHIVARYLTQDAWSGTLRGAGLPEENRPGLCPN